MTTVAMCLWFYYSNVTLQTLYAINGAVLGYSNVIVVPIWIHLKCLWDRNSGHIEDDFDHNLQLKPNCCEC